MVPCAGFSALPSVAAFPQPSVASTGGGQGARDLDAHIPYTRSHAAPGSGDGAPWVPGLARRGTRWRVRFVCGSMVRPGILIGLALAGVLAAPLSGRGDGGTDQNDGGGAAATAGGRPTGTLVFVLRSSRLGAIDVASGRMTLRRVPALAACGPELHVTAGRVVFAGLRRGRTVVYSAPVSLERQPTRLGAAHAFVPSATEGRVWLAGADCSRRTMVGVREVTVDGQVAVSNDRRVPEGWIAGAIDGGLVIQRRRALVVWNPRTRSSARRLPLEAVGDAHGNRLIGCLRSRCRKLVLVDAASASAVAARPTPPYRLDLGAEFSPDGSLVATPAVAGRRWGVALIDTSSGRFCPPA